MVTISIDDNCIKTIDRLILSIYINKCNYVISNIVIYYENQKSITQMQEIFFFVDFDKKTVNKIIYLIRKLIFNIFAIFYSIFFSYKLIKFIFEKNFHRQNTFES